MSYVCDVVMMNKKRRGEETRNERRETRNREWEIEEKRREIEERRGRRDGIYRIYNTSLCEINRELKNRETER